MTSSDTVNSSAAGVIIRQRRPCPNRSFAAGWTMTPESQTPTSLKLRSFIDSVPALAWSALPNGSLDFFNRQFRDYTRFTPDQSGNQRCTGMTSTISKAVGRMSASPRRLARRKCAFVASTESIAGSGSGRHRSTISRPRWSTGVGSIPTSMTLSAPSGSSSGTRRPSHDQRCYSPTHRGRGARWGLHSAPRLIGLAGVIQATLLGVICSSAEASKRY
jgi:hypothetical protein